MVMRFLLLVLALCSLGLRSVAAQDWPCWRGPNSSGTTTARGLPDRWSSSDNIRWKTRIPGEGQSSPIVANNRVFLTSALEDGTRRVVHSLDLKTGRLLWSQELRHDDPERSSAVTGHAAATPATDGKRVLAFFGNAGVVCYDAAGKQLWRHKLDPFDTELGLASSPILGNDRVFLVCDHDGDRFRSFDSFVLALDLATGKEVWKTSRPDLFRSWSTPLLIPIGKDRSELIVAGQDALRAYDPGSGKERWQMPGLTGWVAPSPVFGHGRIYAVSGKNGPILAVAPGSEGSVKSIWKQPTGGPYVCSPVLYEEHLYVAEDGGFLSCYRAASGKRMYRERLQGKFTAALAAGDGKIYCNNETGTTFVIQAGPAYRLLARNEIGAAVLAAPAFAGRDLLLRTETHLYCIQPPER